MAIWDTNLKIGLCTILIKVKVKLLDTYGVIASSPKQLDLARSNVKVTETAHWIYAHADRGFARLGSL